MIRRKMDLEVLLWGICMWKREIWGIIWWKIWRKFWNNFEEFVDEKAESGSRKLDYWNQVAKCYSGLGFTAEWSSTRTRETFYSAVLFWMGKYGIQQCRVVWQYLHAQMKYNRTDERLIILVFGKWSQVRQGKGFIWSYESCVMNHVIIGLGCAQFKT